MFGQYTMRDLKKDSKLIRQKLPEVERLINRFGDNVDKALVSNPEEVAIINDFFGTTKRISEYGRKLIKS
ncbi:hypothetical protein HYW99_00960 [Candidatus Woesearchaeota archaeon]|nr:hypothetical protein [Candidatus Woesearchaeota archaeon]